jgi:hypothetical protein
MIKLLDILREANIRPISDNYLDNQKEIKDPNMVRDFLNYHGISPLAFDIYKYMVKSHNQYPAVVTTSQMRYNNSADGDNALVLFRGGNIELEKERKTLNRNGHSFSHSTMKKGPFSWSLLNQITTEPS